MKVQLKTLTVLLTCILGAGSVLADNQTNTLTTVQSPNSLPFTISIEQAGFQLPVGFHSGVVGEYKGLWIFIAGRINGLHGFGADPFPPDTQNKRIYVVDAQTGTTSSRALNDSSGLTQKQIDTLTVTSPQGFQEGNTLYMTGGYGVDTATGTFDTKPVLTAINLPGIVAWVTQPGNTSNSVVKNIQQVYNPTFQVTGGRMLKIGNTMQLAFGQSFEGVYDPSRTGNYSEQVRQFQITTTNGQLSVNILNSKPARPNPNFHRRDLNIVPALLNNNNTLQYGMIAYAGVFTPTNGVWTVPVVMNETSDPVMADPNLPSTFKQAMNQYVCATAGLYSKKYASMYNIFFGGISYGYYSGSTFVTDSEIPFINQVTTIKMDKNGNFSQYLMANQYPVILSTQVNPGNQLLFGAGAYFIPNNILKYPNLVLSLDNIRKPTVIGYIVGGIQSTLGNTNSQLDSSASPYVFKVTLTPTNPTLATVPQSSKARASSHAVRLTQQVSPQVVNLKQKYNRKYHESSSLLTAQSHHSA